MKLYYLTVNNSKKDVISKIMANTMEQAVVYFAKIKDLSIDDLLKIYTVVE